MALILYDIASFYKKFLIDVNYKVSCSNGNQYMIIGNPENFLHLTGLQDAVPNLDPIDFYYDCINNKYTDVRTLIPSSTDKCLKNKILIKANYFYNIQNCILLKGNLYICNNIIAFCNDFSVGNKTKTHTVLFIYSKQLNAYVPLSNQIDKNSSYSWVNQKHYSFTPIDSIEII